MQQEIIPHLFRTEYAKIVSVLVRSFGIDQIAIAEDIASDTFLRAAETWSQKGVPENPSAWLYRVAKNKTTDLIRKNAVFKKSVEKNLKASNNAYAITPELDLSPQNITDSQLAMIFVACDPCNPLESRIALALNLLCGFGVNEIASAFLSNREVIYKRLQRAKTKLKEENIQIIAPDATAVSERLPSVLLTLYLLFNEGYLATNKDLIIQNELCYEAMRLASLLLNHESTASSPVYALLSLMCFQVSRFDARTTENGEAILYADQDPSLWNQDLIAQGKYFLEKSSEAKVLTRYHLEASIASWHTFKVDSKTKWEAILRLYNELLIIEYSPVAALNRTFALSKVRGKEEAIIEAEKISLEGNLWYHALLGELYQGVDNTQAIQHLKKALQLATSSSDKKILSGKLDLYNKG